MKRLIPSEIDSKSQISCASTIKRGSLIFPSYGKDLATRKRVWAILLGEEKPDPILFQIPNGNETNGESRESFSVRELSTSISETKSEEVRAEDKDGKKLDANLEEDKTKRLQEMTDQLRSLLRIGQSGDTKPTSTPNSIRSHSERQPRMSPSLTPSSMSSPRVPFTAKVPRPPPFLPFFSDDGDDQEAT